MLTERLTETTVTCMVICPLDEALTVTDMHHQGTSTEMLCIFYYLYQAMFFFIKSFTHRPCLVPEKFYKIFQIPRHIKSLDTCMEY